MKQFTHKYMTTTPTGAAQLSHQQSVVHVQAAIRDVADAKLPGQPAPPKTTPTPSLATNLKLQAQQKQLDLAVRKSTTQPKSPQLSAKLAAVDMVLASPSALNAVAEKDPRCKFVSRLDAISNVTDKKLREEITDLTYRQFGPQSDTPCVFVPSQDDMKKRFDNKTTIAKYADHYKQEIAKSGSVEGEPLKLASASLQMPPPTLTTTSTDTATGTGTTTAPLPPRPPSLSATPTPQVR